ncbi:hypothetical protein [Cellulophaga sp. L1A9]|uniref:hypothetical protein n=1 Tax=Cellulophaga sp. L1A9 TaxID=2686362 RepID=UPI00131E4993|nr:hypothetical protein [Cellulophaga sp. L1A9]
MIKFFNYFFLLFFLCSCTGQDIKLNEGTFIEVSKINEKDILLYPCSASINTIVLTGGFIEEITGQETIRAEILNKKIKKNVINFKLKNDNNYTFELIDSKKHYWKINERIYVENKFSNTIEKIQEPCSECFSEEECDLLRKQNNELALEEFIYKDKKTLETIKGDFNNDALEDAIIVTDIGDKNNNSEHYLLTILLQSSKKGLYKLFFESSSILPCLNCEEWNSDADYSYYDLKLDNGTLSFSTNRTNNNLNEWDTNTYIFKNNEEGMKLQKVTKNFGKLDSDDEITKELGDFNFLDLKKFNVYKVE